jgi:glycine cleavage system H protein
LTNPIRVSRLGKLCDVNVPSDLLYTSTHEWVRIEGDIATIGITDHAQSELGDIVFVELPNPGRVLQVGDTFGSVESVKTVSDVYAPVPGEVTEVNGALGAQSELLNSDPFGAGWLIKIRVSSPVEGLLDADAYSASIAH